MDCYGKKVYLLIDKYDTPFIASNAGGYHGEVRGLLAGIFGSSLKGNPALKKAMYDGYLFGTNEMYNPWHVTSYAVRKRLEPDSSKNLRGE